jgi:ABC-type transport system involved in cytochrome bd biosynthesis fused ATPase/permease subunit
MADQLRALSDLELCRAWRRSFVELDAAASPATRLAVVQLRQAYLDELGRRRPDALQAWFDSGGRAASGPDKFFLDAS